MANKWRGFIRESISFIEPKGWKAWIKFISYLPIAATKFYWFMFKSMMRGY